MTNSDQRRSVKKTAGLLGIICLLLFCLAAYGGIRSPDEEIIFRVGLALAERGSFALDSDLEAWPGFAVATGTDNRIYSAFAPAQAILLAPVIRAALSANRTGWYERSPFPIPVSLSADATSLQSFLLRQPPADMEKHALRFLVSFYSPVVATMMVVAFFFLILRITGATIPAFVTAALMAFATPVWSYSGTLFREPLTMLFIILCLLFLTGNDPVFTGRKKRFRPLFPAGLMLGLAFASHVSAVLFVPFFIVYAGWPADIRPKSGQPAWTRAIILLRFLRPAAVFTAGFLVPALAFAAYNYARFENVLEVGRLSSSVTYGTLTLPFQGLAGLLVSPGKGLLWFCPLAVAGLWCWPRLHATHRVLSIILITAVLFRLLFISSSTDWHGGFCLGPRLLLPVIPLLFIPLSLFLQGFLVRDPTDSKKKLSVMAALFSAAVAQQIYFCLGEPISFYYILRNYFYEQGISIVAGNEIYFQWGASPLLHLLKARRGPFLLQEAALSNDQLLAMVVLVFVLLAGLATLCLQRMQKKS